MDRTRVPCSFRDRLSAKSRRMNGFVCGSRVACNAIRTSLFDNVVATQPGLPPRPNQPVVIVARAASVDRSYSRLEAVQRTRCPKNFTWTATDPRPGAWRQPFSKNPRHRVRRIGRRTSETTVRNYETRGSIEERDCETQSSSGQR